MASISSQNYMAISLCLMHIIRDKNRANDKLIPFLEDVWCLLDKDKDIDLGDGAQIDNIVFALKEIGKGKDGIFGTSDDIIPLSLINDIASCEKTSVLTDLFNMFIKNNKNKNKNASYLKMILCFKCLS